MDERVQIVMLTLLAAGFFGLVGGWVAALIVCPSCPDEQPKKRKRTKGGK